MCVNSRNLPEGEPGLDGQSFSFRSGSPRLFCKSRQTALKSSFGYAGSCRNAGPSAYFITGQSQSHLDIRAFQRSAATGGQRDAGQRSRRNMIEHDGQPLVASIDLIRSAPWFVKPTGKVDDGSVVAVHADGWVLSEGDEGYFFLWDADQIG